MKNNLIIINVILFTLILVFVYFRIKQIIKIIENVNSIKINKEQYNTIFFIIVLITIIFMLILDSFILYTM